MISKIFDVLSRKKVSPNVSVKKQYDDGTFSLRTEALFQEDPYLFITESPLNVISVFDDLRYDRSDMDSLSPAMRKYVAKQLKQLEFKQLSGKTFIHQTSGVRCHIPRLSVQGASPFHAIDYAKKHRDDFYILTPTQTACVIINYYDLEDTIEKLIVLIKQHPINLNKLEDYLENTCKHKEFANAIPHLRYQQRMAVENFPLKKTKPIKWFQ